jgi:phage tail-like protein
MALPDIDSSVGHSFGLEFDGVVIKQITEVSGLKIDQDEVELKQDTDSGNLVIKKLPGRPKGGEVTLTRGLTGDNSFEKVDKRLTIRQSIERPQGQCDHRLRL